jgi:hypothetical protein
LECNENLQRKAMEIFTFPLLYFTSSSRSDQADNDKTDHEGKINAKFYAKQLKKQQKDYFKDVLNKK